MDGESVVEYIGSGVGGWGVGEGGGARGVCTEV